MKYIDISWPIFSEMTAYKNKKTVEIQNLKNFEKDAVRESLLSLNVHTGTHIDAPSHFISDGKAIDNVSLDMFFGPCRVLDFSHINYMITEKDLQGKNIQKGERILLKTKNSLFACNASFVFDFVYLSKQAAAYLVQKKIICVGIDYLGIERAQPKHETHISLLEKDIGVIEGLRLQSVVEGRYELLCLPLAVTHLEASPARALLLPSRYS